MMMLRNMNKIWQSLGEAAPILALGVLLVLPLLINHERDDAALVLTRNIQVQHAVNNIPYRLGDWVGEDMEIPVSAVELLHPNAILSRRFSRLIEGTSLHMLIVHCSDARDMQGHYPPICYPANGWIRAEDGSPGDTATAEIAGETLSMRIYNFRRLDEWGGERALRVFNFFLLPSGETTIDLRVVSRLVERSAFSVQGVAQVQLVMTGEMDFEKARQAAEDILNQTMPFLDQLGSGDGS